jgi:hypothetical protein
MKLALLASLAVIGVFGGGAASANAAVTGACTYEGTTNTLTPVLYTGGSGNFSFTGTAVCAWDSGTPGVGTIVANGTYSNLVCGTGTADGTANITVNGTTVTISFHIQFAASAGVATATGNDTGAGVLQISPAPGSTPGTPPAGNCVTQFDVVGNLVGSAN